MIRDSNPCDSLAVSSIICGYGHIVVSSGFPMTCIETRTLKKLLIQMPVPSGQSISILLPLLTGGVCSSADTFLAVSLEVNHEPTIVDFHVWWAPSVILVRFSSLAVIRMHVWALRYILCKLTESASLCCPTHRPR